jgi:hypothetical protein
MQSVRPRENDIGECVRTSFSTDLRSDFSDTANSVVLFLEPAQKWQKNGEKDGEKRTGRFAWID